jgi:hypothetical protein
MVSIDRVYQKVLALANKEQRGYITPQEFNLFADHAQMEIFEQYFYDLNQFKRLPGNNHEYSDIVSIIKDKISQFEVWAIQDNITVLNEYGDVNLEDNIPDSYRLGEVSRESIVCEQLSPKEYSLRSRSSLTKPSNSRPVFIKYNNGYDRIKIYPHPVNSDGTPITVLDPQSPRVRADYTRKPTKPNWAYVVINNKPLYNATSAVDFELHASEEAELVYRILSLAGVAIEKTQLSQVAGALGSAQIQQEKQ